MKYLLVLWILGLMVPGQAQDCNCLQSLKRVEKAYEQDLASYQHQVIEYSREAIYKAYKKEINDLAKQTVHTRDCIGLVARYQAFFRDQHLFITYQDGYYPFKSNTDTALIQQTFKKEPRLDNDNMETDERVLEGRWYAQEGTFAIDIIPHQSIHGEWAGILASNFPPFWLEGQIKLELSRDKAGHLYGLYWRGTRVPQYLPVTINNAVLEIGKNLRFYRTPPNKKQASASLADTLQFKKLSEKTTYLRIPTFDPEQYERIDSMVESNIEDIQQAPNLIIDVRNNEGGGDRSFRALLPLIFQKEIIPDPYTASVWVSPANLHFYDSTKYEYAENAADSLEGQRYINRLKPYTGKFEPIVFTQDTLSFIYDGPQKIGIITNRGCASTTEGFVLLAKESKKVTQFGENTSGAVSYGDWRQIQVPGLPIWVSCTTKKMTFFNGKDIECIGVEPDVKLDDEHENKWIELVRQYLEQ